MKMTLDEKLRLMGWDYHATELDIPDPNNVRTFKITIKAPNDSAFMFEYTIGPKVNRILLSDLIFGLLVDAECGERSYQEFCDYQFLDPDWITSINDYKDCVRTKKWIDKLPNLDELKSLFEDY